MKNLILRNYNLALILLIILVIGLAYYAGVLQGKRGQVATVELSCTEDTLSKLEVPLERIASKTGSKITLPLDQLTASATKQSQAVPKGKYVGSKNGTKYYLPTCATVKRIKLENYVWFDSPEDATLQGYTPGKC